MKFNDVLFFCFLLMAPLSILLWISSIIIGIHIALVCPYNLPAYDCLFGLRERTHRESDIENLPFDIPLYYDDTYTTLLSSENVAEAGDENEDELTENSCNSESGEECVDKPLTKKEKDEYKDLVQPLAEEIIWQLGIGWQTGMAVAVYVNGQEVLNVGAGGRRTNTDLDFAPQTLNVGFELGQLWEMMALGIAVDRGYIDMDTPISHYWEEFGQNGKESITLKDILGHRAGLGIGLREECKIDRKRMVIDEDCLVKHKPRSPRGKLANRGVLSGAFTNILMRKIDPKHRSLIDFVKEEMLSQRYNNELFCPIVKAPKQVMNYFSLAVKMSSFYDIFSNVPQLLLPRWLTDIAISSFGGDSRGAYTHKSRLSEDEYQSTREKVMHVAPQFDNLTLPGYNFYDPFSSLDWLRYENPTLNAVFSARSLAYALHKFAFERNTSDAVVSEKIANLFFSFQDDTGVESDDYNITGYDVDDVTKHIIRYTVGGVSRMRDINSYIALDQSMNNCFGTYGRGSSFAATCKNIGPKAANFTIVVLANLQNPVYQRSHDFRAAQLLDAAVVGVTNSQIKREKMAT